MIYCVEDDPDIREIEVYTLRATGFQAEGFGDGAAFFAALGPVPPELVLLDVMLPGEDGVTILRKLRAAPSTASVPVVMATARGAEYDKIASLDLGADDYLVKPFGMMEMVARIRAILRRAAPKDRGQTLRVGKLALDSAEHAVFADGKPVQLTLKEFALLRLLMSRPGRVFTREQLLSEIWGVEYDSETRTVDMHVRTLRGKLGACGGQIGTVRGLGYRMEEGQ